MSARLHVLLGAGGVGKTTLAAGYALALARTTTGRVGLLGIDPSRRLKDALGLALADQETPVLAAAPLRAAVLDPHQCLRRWVAEKSRDPRDLDQLLHSPLFCALSDRLATATDVFAAARVAEWAERDPLVTDLVVDTAPGSNAIEFLTRPERVAELLGGALVRWLRLLSPRRGGTPAAGRLRGAARRVLSGVTRLGGANMVVEFVDFFSLVDGWLSTLLDRVRFTQRWLRDARTRILLVTAVRDDGAQAARAMATLLRQAGLGAHAVIVNRVLASPLLAFAGDLEQTAVTVPASAPVIHYALRYARAQERVVAATRGLAPASCTVPEMLPVGGESRLDVLARIGEMLRSQLG